MIRSPLSSPPMPNPGQPTISPGGTGEVVRRLQRALRRTQDLGITVSGLSCLRFWVLPLIGAVSICVAATVAQCSEIDDLIAQDKAISEANASLDKTYQKVMADLDGKVAAGDASAKNLKDALIAAERAWIKWRDAEALMRAYAGGAVGGSALNEDLHSALLDLIKERKEYLQSLLEGS
jgi:uncharacterized protein YecT (DUF1311 family)